MKAKLTIRSIEGVRPDKRDIVIWDTDITGFACKVTPTGRRTFFYYYRNADGRPRRPSIGVFGQMKPEQARKIALQWAADVSSGGDPSASRKAGKSVPTFANLAERYLAEHAEAKKKASSLNNDHRLLKKKILPALGQMRVTAIQRNDIAGFHHSMRKTPYEANRALSLLHKMFALAEVWGIRPDGSNPASRIGRFKEVKRERFLSGEEIVRLSQSLDYEDERKLSSPSVTGAIRLLLLTGCRLNEILTLQWDHVDFENRLLRLPDSKTGAKRVFLTDQSIAVLQHLRAVNDSANGYVINGHRKGAHLVNLQKPWRRIRQRAGLDDVRIHDLRHTYASFGAGAGMSLPMIGKLLGHTQAGTTERYAHLAQDPARQGAEQISALIAEHLQAARLLE